ARPQSPRAAARRALQRPRRPHPPHHAGSAARDPRGRADDDPARDARRRRGPPARGPHRPARCGGRRAGRHHPPRARGRQEAAARPRRRPPGRAARRAALASGRGEPPPRELPHPGDQGPARAARGGRDAAVLTPVHTPHSKDTPMKRSILTVAAAAAVASLALTGCAGENAAPVAASGDGGAWSASTLNIDFATYNPLSLIIKEQGWLEEALGEDVTVNWTQSLGSNKANEGLRAGALDVGSTAGSAALLARANGSPIKVISIYTQPEWSALGALPGSGIDSVEDLRGKTVAVTVGTDPYFFLLQALDEAGIDPSEVDIQNLQHADGGAALVYGTVDAWSGLDPMMAAHERDAGVGL